MTLRRTTADCRKIRCPELVEVQDVGRTSRTCRITGRIPGNMQYCPLERRKEVMK